jgi:hypothetical protein
MPTLLGILFAPGLTAILGCILHNCFGLLHLNLFDTKIALLIAYLLSFPISILGVLCLRKLRKQTIYHCLTLGALIGFLTPWVYFSLIPFLRGCWQLPTVPITRKIILNVLLNPGPKEITPESTAFGLLWGLIYWSIVYRLVPYLHNQHRCVSGARINFLRLLSILAVAVFFYVSAFVLRTEEFETNASALMEVNGVEALKKLKLLAYLRDSAAQLTVGFIYAEGLGGVPKDVDEAIYWFRLRAAQLSSEAGILYLVSDDELYVAEDYLHGAECVKADPVEAKKWLQLAAKDGNKEAAALLAQLYPSKP